MKTHLIILFLISSVVLKSQTPENPDDNNFAGSNTFCNGDLTSATNCIVIVNTSPITGNLLSDDGTDYFAFSPGLTKSTVFSYNNTSTTPINVKIYEYTGTIGVDAALGALALNIPNNTSTPFTFVGSKKYVLEIDKSGPGTDYSIAFTGGSLPVLLRFFRAKKEQNTVKIEWNSSFEEAFFQYEIEKSVDLVSFEKIGTVSPQAFKKEGRNYEFIDRDPSEGFNFYRLKMIDNDRTFEYSKIVQVVYSQDASHLLIAPNPVANILNLPIEYHRNITQITIANIKGETVRELYGPSEKINVDDLPPGVYVLSGISSFSNLCKIAHKFVKF